MLPAFQDLTFDPKDLSHICTGVHVVALPNAPGPPPRERQQPLVVVPHASAASLQALLRVSRACLSIAAAKRFASC